jgi:hypothetical protein
VLSTPSAAECLPSYVGCSGILDFSIVNVALPSIETAFASRADAVQRIITAYAIAARGILKTFERLCVEAAKEDR